LSAGLGEVISLVDRLPFHQSSDIMMKPFIALLCALLLPATAVAEVLPTDSCHCFRKRGYNPADRFESDPYLLTSCYNSFLAERFSISKQTIVMKKMRSGISSDNLLIGLYLARELDTDLDVLLAIIDNGGSWQSILNSEQGRQRQQDLSFHHTTIQTDSGVLASNIHKQLITEWFPINDAELDTLTQKGLSHREIILLHSIARLRPAFTVTELLNIKDSRAMSWSQLADRAGLTERASGRFLLHTDSRQDQ
jgi:hypothetical protein